MSTMTIITSLKSCKTHTTPTQCVILRTPFANTNTYRLSAHNICSKQLHNFKRQCCNCNVLPFRIRPTLRFQNYYSTHMMTKTDYDKHGLPRDSREKLHVTDTWRSESKIREMCACHCFCQLSKDVPVCVWEGTVHVKKKKKVLNLHIEPVPMNPHLHQIFVWGKFPV